MSPGAAMNFTEDPVDFTEYCSRSQITDCSQRDVRCANALKVKSLHDLLYDEGHVIVNVVNECTLCDKWRDCHHPKDVFNSTHNSRRRVHAYLWWKTKLGIDFPVMHDLLDGEVWKNLEGCDYGTKRGNGHAKVKGEVCVNPYHYVSTRPEIMLDYLAKALRKLNFVRHEDISNAITKAYDAEDTRDGFEDLCRLIRRRMGDTSPFREASSPLIESPKLFAAMLAQAPRTPEPSTPNLGNTVFFAMPEDAVVPDGMDVDPEWLHELDGTPYDVKPEFNDYVKPEFKPEFNAYAPVPLSATPQFMAQQYPSLLPSVAFLNGIQDGPRMHGA